MSKRDAYIEKMKDQLDDLNAKMSELEAKAQEAKDDARAKYKEEMKKLSKQSKLAIAKLDEIKSAGEDTCGKAWSPKWKKCAMPSSIRSTTSSRSCRRV